MYVGLILLKIRFCIFIEDENRESREPSYFITFIYYNIDSL